MNQMKLRTQISTIAFLLFTCMVFGQSDLDVFYPKHIENYGTYAVQFVEGVEIPSSIKIKYRANGWTYVLADREQLYECMVKGTISKIYREPSEGMLLNDSTRVTHFVNQVHEGLNMDFPFTGKGVIMGYVDNGLDVFNPDFKDSLGNSRVLRFWNQGQSAPHARTPSKYGYGRVYTNVDINNNINVGNINASSHGTTVTGTGSGNGLANGKNKGIAPDCNIVAVRTNFNAPSWTLTVAEGVDFIFDIAESLGMPAVVNLSLGTALGSHDGKDPAGLYIDSLLNEKPGRIVVSATGNSGAWQAYHVQMNLSADTNFVWMIPNPALVYGSPGVYFDLWADTTDIENMHFAFGADAPGPVYRGNTSFKQVDFSNPLVQNDTIFGINNDVIGSVIYQGQVVGPNYNLQAIIFTDSLDYRIRFLATGANAGKIDMWSSANIGRSDFSMVIPDTNLYPEFTKYVMPDTLQSIWSSWICSDQVISVGNIHNRKNYIDFNGNVYPPGGGTIPSGSLSVNSSKGPNRQGNIKPEVVATGDYSLSSRVTTESYANHLLDQGGMHVLNGGTSMASPVVAGIAALYLEKCPKSTWLDFKNDLINSTFSDSFTGNLPNYAFGYGKAHALNTLLQTEFNPVLNGVDVLCSGQTELGVVAPNLDLMIWNTNDTTNLLSVNQVGTYHGMAINEKGCKNYTDTITVVNDTSAPSGTAPADTWVSCIASIPLPDPNLVGNLSDNCGIDEVIHLKDSLHTDSCIEFVERIYRITDEAANFSDVTQIITILQGTSPLALSNNETITPIHACNGIFVSDENCDSKLISLDVNGNILDFEDVDITVFHDFIDDIPNNIDAVNSGGSGYYEITDGLNTFRLSKKMFVIEAAGNFNLNGGVKVRLYFDNDDFGGIVNDVPDFGLISNFGWFKSSHHNTSDVVGEMNPDAPLLASATIINPIETGTEMGVSFAEFLVTEFSTFGFFASTQMTPLPVTLTQFSAQCNENIIDVKWSTSSEFEASHYVLQTSRDGISWTSVEQIPAAGNTNQIQHYALSTERTSGFQYFRLNQVDLNGESTFFGPISAFCENNKSTWSAFPNPSASEIQIAVSALQVTENTLLQFVDLSGKLVYEAELKLNAGQNHFYFDVSNFSNGIYIISLSSSSETFEPIRFAVQK